VRVRGLEVNEPEVKLAIDQAKIADYKKLLDSKIDAIMEALRSFELKFFHRKLKEKYKDLNLKAKNG